MRVALVLPRHMRFSPKGATSIDLCAHELLQHSKHSKTTRVICADEKDPFPGIDLATFDRRQGGFSLIRAISREITNFNPDIIVVHQHLRTVFLLSILHPKIPVVIHRHNYYSAKLNILSRMAYNIYWKRISAVFFVSESCRSGFLQHSAFARHRTFVIHNGLDLEKWNPLAERTNEIIYAGRVTPEKGVLEGAKAVAIALYDRPDWTATFYLAQPQTFPDYAVSVRTALSGLGARARIVYDAEFDQVKAGFERAAIALVPSVWKEPFGRAAIEAMAGGAALICSGRGGLAEVIGVAEDNAALKVEVTVYDILSALDRLIDDEALRAKIASGGLARVKQQFSIRHIAAVYDRHLEILAQQGETRLETFAEI